MLSRALSLATVMLLVGFATVPVQAQNLEAGKSPSQIFSGSCTVCHKSPRGLLKTIAPGSLPGFLRQHYTTSSDMAGALSAYLISNGASDQRYNGGGLTKQGAESRSEPKQSAAPEAGEPARGRRRPTAQEAARSETAKPDDDGRNPQEAHPGRRAKRLALPASEAPDAAGKPVEREPASAAEAPHGKQKLGKKGRRNREEPVAPDTAKDEPAAGETPKSETSKSETLKPEPAKEEAKPAETKPVEAKPAEEAKPEAPKAEAPKVETPALRADPVPAVTPAPKSSETEPPPAPAATTAPVSPPPAASDPSASKP